MAASAKPGGRGDKELVRKLLADSNFIRLVLIGLAMQLIYTIYVVAFPLFPNARDGGPAADLEILMRGHRWLAAVYVIGILLLYYLFWQAIRTVSGMTGSFRPVKFLILAFAVVFSLTLILLYPITAIDLFGYVVRGRIWTIYGESPLLSPPNKFPQDPYLALAGEFDGLVSVYGPLWEMLVQIPLQLGATAMLPGVIGVKVIVLFFYLLCAVLIGWAAIFDPATSPDNASVAGLTFFAWNPLVLIQAPGNGHNDMVFMALVILGIVLWQRQKWWAAGLTLALAVAVKVTALLIVPLFGVALLRPLSGRRLPRLAQLLRAAGVMLLGLAVLYFLYALLGPVARALEGLLDELFSRRGFTVASGLRVILREILPRHVAPPIPRTTARYIFIAFYAWLLLQVWRHKLNLITAGFLAYFSQLILGATFRIWYPMWLVPLAALQLTPGIFWRTFLFGLTAELSIFNYFVVWRWWLRTLPWGRSGFLSQYWDYWTVMYTLTVPWLFGIPLFGPILIKWRTQKRGP